MKKIFFACIALLACSCSKDYLFKRDERLISQELKTIKDTDQGVRSFIGLSEYRIGIRSFESVNDSLWVEGKYELVKSFDFNKIQSEELQILKLSPIKKELFEEYKQQSFSLMQTIDNLNRGKMYKLIKKYGYPSFHNRKWTDTINNRVGTASILTHFNYDTKEEKKLLKLLIKEYFQERIEKGEMGQIMWNYDGRNGYPFDYIIDEKYLKKLLNE